MYVVLIDVNTNLKDALALKFLSVGLQIFSGDNPKTVQKIIEEKGPGYLFVKINQLNSPWLNFLAQIRQYKDESLVKFIILSDKKDRQFLQTLLLLNVAGLIPSNLEDDEIYTRLYQIVSKSSDSQHEKREHQRVVPRDSDEILMNLSIPNTSTILTASVINISIGGVAMQFTSSGESKWLSVGMVIESAQIRLNHKIGMTALKIVMVKDSIVGARFVRPTDYFLNLLGRYLLERLSGG